VIPCSGGPANGSTGAFSESQYVKTEQPIIVESTGVPWTYRILVHALSIFIPGTMLTMFILCGPDGPPESEITLSLAAMGFAMSFIWSWLLYAIAGGFDWSPGGIGMGRTVLFALLGGIVFAIPLFVFWVIVRIVSAMTFRLPVAEAAGKIWVTGKQTGE
jgi:hypothetical protein